MDSLPLLQAAESLADATPPNEEVETKIKIYSAQANFCVNEAMAVREAKIADENREKDRLFKRADALFGKCDKLKVGSICKMCVCKMCARASAKCVPIYTYRPKFLSPLPPPLGFPV